MDPDGCDHRVKKDVRRCHPPTQGEPLDELRMKKVESETRSKKAVPQNGCGSGFSPKNLLQHDKGENGSQQTKAGETKPVQGFPRSDGRRETKPKQIRPIQSRLLDASSLNGTAYLFVAMVRYKKMKRPFSNETKCRSFRALDL